MNAHLPRLLDDAMSERTRLHPSKLSIEPNGEELSTANMTLPVGEPKLHAREWVELFTVHGSAGIYRVTRCRDEIGQEQRVTLKHGLCALEDAVIPGEGTISGAASEVLEEILSYQKQTLWIVGEVADGAHAEIDYNNTNALEALESALSMMPDYALTFDQTSLPWRLGLARLPTQEGAEARPTRNLRGVTVEEDDTELCTRVYVDGREGFPRDGPTIGTWGAVERVLTVPEGATDEEVSAYADAYLQEHQEPARTVTLEAWDLSERTGEALDAFRLWKRVRVPIAGKQRDEHITSLGYPDVFGDPENVRVTIGRRERTVSDMLRELMLRAAGTDRAVSRNRSGIRNNLTKLEDTYRELTELNGEMAERFNQVSIELDAQQAQIRLKASSEEVSALASRVSSAEITMDGMKAQIDLKASRTEVDGIERRVSEAEIAIDGAQAKINMKVSKGEVIAQINLSTEGVLIQASKINLEGYVTASRLESELAAIDRSISNSILTNTISVTGTATTRTVDTQYLYINGEYISAHSASIVTDVSFGTYTLGSVWGYSSSTATTRSQFFYVSRVDLNVSKSSITYYA